MHLGFAALETGLTRAKNTVNILFKNTSIVAIGLLTYALCGFNLMYPGDFILGDWLGVAGFGLDEKLTKITGNPIQQFEVKVKFIKSMKVRIPNLYISIQDLPNTVLRYINKPRKGVKLIDTLQQQGILSGN